MEPFICHAFYCVSTWGGYELQVADDGGSARVRSSFDDKESPRPRWQEIKYNRAGAPFVTFHGRRLYLDNFFRPWWDD